MADRITETAGPTYFGNTNVGYARWSLWPTALEKPDNHARLESVFYEATRKVVTENLMDALSLMIEGAITGHPDFRTLMLTMLEREFRIRCTNGKVDVFWLDPPPSVNLEQIQKRGRPHDAGVTLRDVEQRWARYSTMMKRQTVRRIESPLALKSAGVAFFSDAPEE